MNNLNRRNFIKGAAVVAASASLPRFAIGSAHSSANSKLNVAIIGAGGRGRASINALVDENLVAFCDVDEVTAASTYKDFPDVPRFQDFREMLDKKEKEIDAVVIATPDHTHFVATYASMVFGKHVLTEKPLVHNVWQARTLRKAAKHFKVITQMGNQGHATEGIRYVKEWYQAGVIGEVDEVIAYNPGPRFGPDRSFQRPSTLPATSQPVPTHLNWDLWKGPTAPNVKYNEVYLPKSWRGFFQFGNGQLGDWACHTLDAPFWALELGMPTSVNVRNITEPWPGIVSKTSVVEWEFQREGRNPLKLSWHEGRKPEVNPTDGEVEWGDDFNMAMVGSKGVITHNARPNSPRLYPESYWQDFRKNLPEKKFDRIKGNQVDEWVRAIKAEGPMPGSNFEYSTRLTEMALLGVLAQKTGKGFTWESKRMQTDDAELNAYIKEPVRRGWGMGEELWT
jgi:predicted dehydrogenase